MKEVTKHWGQFISTLLQKLRWNAVRSRSLVGVKRAEDSGDLVVKDYRKRHKVSKW